MLALSLIATPAGAAVFSIGGHIYGVTPIKGVSAESLPVFVPLARPLATPPSGPHNLDEAPKGGGQLLYNGGPVMHSVTTHVIYWDPNNEFTATTKAIFGKFFTDVAAASGSPSNVFAIAGQYKDTTGHAAYTSTAGGEATDSTAYPASGCTPPTGVDEGPYTTCITDAQLRTELAAYVGANKLTTGPSQQYFVLLPHKVVTCLEALGSICSNNAYCAYHSNISGGAEEKEIIYADIPFSLLDSGHAKRVRTTGTKQCNSPTAIGGRATPKRGSPTWRSRPRATSTSMPPPIRLGPPILTRTSLRSATSATASPPSEKRKESAMTRTRSCQPSAAKPKQAPFSTSRSTPTPTTCRASGTTPPKPA